MKTSRSRPVAETIDRFRARHMSLETRQILAEDGLAKVLVNESESPLAWLARRKGRDGRAMISSHQFIAGEKLRADFTRAQMAPRMTANWAEPGGPRKAGHNPGEATDVMVASRQRVGQALDACGPEFSGLLMDVCCFLRGLEDVERERAWPPRSAKVVLQLALDRLARHYGLLAEARGRASGMRTWMADDAGRS
jgi:hypothetical protein